MAYTTVDNPELYFQCKLYTGSGNIQAITLDGDENMQPDFIWCKSRGETRHHYLADVIRGVKGRLRSDANNAEYTANSTSGFDSFDSDGFTLEADSSSLGLNESGHTMVSWNWKAGTSFTNDASSTGVGTIDSTGSINITAGFSIISYTGTGSNGTIAHGIDAEPKCIIFKDRDTASDWRMYHVGVGNTGALTLNNTNVTQTNSVFFQDTTPTSTVFSLGTGTDVNNTNSFIAYCFAEKKGFSKFGSYTGNGNADGTFVYTGFKPAFILVKGTSVTSNWTLLDNKRNTFNVVNAQLQADLTNAESSSDSVDFTAQGFKVRNQYDSLGSSGNTYIFMAFAESPFVNSNGVPNNAR